MLCIFQLPTIPKRTLVKILTSYFGIRLVKIIVLLLSHTQKKGQIVFEISVVRVTYEFVAIMEIMR